MRRFGHTSWAGLVLVAALALTGACGDDDGAGDNNNVNDNGNANNNNGGGDCTDGETRCTGAALELCVSGQWGAPTDCAASGQVCRESDTASVFACEPLAWQWRTVEIEDPIMVGSSLNTPVDGVSFAYDPGTDGYVSGFGRDVNTPANTHLWHVDGGDGTHAKKPLTGQVYSPTDAFCMGSEDWCQYVGFDPDSGEWVILGPSTTAALRVDAGWVGSLTPVSGSSPPDNWINHSHRFAWPARQLFLFGATGPAGFSDTVYAFDLDTHSWSAAASGLPQTDDNCLAYDTTNDRLLSVGGRVTTDGGNTTQTEDSLLTIDPAPGTYTRDSLPSGIGPRRGVACAYDAGRHLLYVYGGSVVNDRWNEAENEYHNDLWALDLATSTWVLLLADTPSGTLNPPDSYGDQSFEGFPEGPNFGQNRGHMLWDGDTDRLLIVGAVPIFTHEQLYTLRLAGVDQLL